MEELPEVVQLFLVNSLGIEPNKNPPLYQLS